MRQRTIITYIQRLAILVGFAAAACSSNGNRRQVEVQSIAPQDGDLESSNDTAMAACDPVPITGTKLSGAPTKPECKDPVDPEGLPGFGLRVGKSFASYSPSAEKYMTVQAEVFRKKTNKPVTDLDNKFVSKLAIFTIGANGNKVRVPATNSSNGLWAKSFTTSTNPDQVYTAELEISDRSSGKALLSLRENAKSETLDASIYLGLIFKKYCFACTSPHEVTDTLVSGLRISSSGLDTIFTEKIGEYLYAYTEASGMIFSTVGSDEFQFFVQPGMTESNGTLTAEAFGFRWNGKDKPSTFGSPIFALESGSLLDWRAIQDTNGGYLMVTTEKPAGNTSTLKTRVIQPNMSVDAPKTIFDFQTDAPQHGGTGSIFLGGLASNSGGTFLNFESSEWQLTTAQMTRHSDTYTLFSGRTPERLLQNSYSVMSNQTGTLSPRRAGDAVAVGDGKGTICYLNSTPVSPISSKVQLLCMDPTGTVSQWGEIDFPGPVTRRPQLVADWLGQRLYVTILGTNAPASRPGARMYVFENGAFSPFESIESYFGDQLGSVGVDLTLTSMIDAYNHLIYYFAARGTTDTKIHMITRLAAGNYKVDTYSLGTSMGYGTPFLTSNAALRQLRPQAIAPSELSTLPK